MEIRAVVNQCGIAMELHGDGEVLPIMLISVDNLEMLRKKMADSNPDMCHATIGQLAVIAAKRMFSGITVSDDAWTYNASADQYSRA